MKTKLLVATLLAGSTMFAETHISIGIGAGGHGYAAPPAVAYRPHYPGPGYTWVDGYWDHAGPRRFWHEGYWARPSYGRSYAIAPRYESNRNDGERYSNGYNGSGRDASRDNRTSPAANSFNSNNNAGSRGAGSGPNGNFSNAGSGNRDGNFSNGNGN